MAFVEYVDMKRVIKSFLNSSNIKNSGWIIGQQVFQMLIQLVVSILTARYLGPSNYGTLNYTVSFVTFFLSIATLEMESVVIKKIIEHPDEEGLYLGSSMLLRVLSSVFSMVSVCLLVFMLNPSEPIKVVLVFLQSFQLLFKSVQILDSWFQRYLKSKYVSIGKMVACIIVSAYRVFLLVTAKNVLWFAFSNSLTDGVISLVEWINYKRQNGQPLRYSFKIGKYILAESYHFVVSGLMSAVYCQMDRIMIGQMLTDTDVGLYSTATAISGMWLFVPMAIISSFRPMIMELKNSGNEKMYITRLEQLYSGIIWLCIVVSVVVYLGAGVLINILYGTDYLGAVPTLRIMIWVEMFAVMGTARGIWVLCENKSKYVKYFLGIGAVVNVALNYMLLPVWGIEGAAFATLLTQITTSIVAPLLFAETKVHTKIVMESVLCKWFFKKEGI